LSSNIKRKLGFKINVINNKSEEVEILIQEQIPVSTSEDIEITLLEISGANFNKETGVLEWKIALKPGESKELTYIYEIDMPYNTMIY
jgi:hypothetical protein